MVVSVIVFDGAENHFSLTAAVATLESLLLGMLVPLLLRSGTKNVVQRHVRIIVIIIVLCRSLIHPMAIFITIMGTHGHFRYTLVRAYVCIFLSSTELTDDEKLQNTIRKHLKLLYN